VILADGKSQVHSFDSPVDKDFLKVVFSAGTTYVIKTSKLGTKVDTEIFLLDGTGKSVLDSNDNDLVNPENGQASRIDFVPKTTGGYLVKVTNRYGLGGCDHGAFEYQISITKHLPTPTPMPTATPTPSPTPTLPASTKLYLVWNDQELLTLVYDVSQEGQPPLVASWSLAELQARCRENGLINAGESLEPDTQGITPGFIGLKIRPGEDWLRVGSLEGHEGLICRVSQDQASCWQIHLQEPWLRR